MGKEVFHVHTYRCGHASGDSDEAYVKRAIEIGAEKITFTDHAPFPGNPFTGRMLYEQLPEYTASLKALKEKYKRQIEIVIGMEIEYLPSYKAYYENLIGNQDIEFLLLGQHHCEMSDGSWSFQHKGLGLMDSQVKGVKSGYFKAVAHPDKYMLASEVEKAKELIAECSKRGVLLEHNITNKEKKEFWDLVPDGIDIIYGCDAHSVDGLWLKS